MSRDAGIRVCRDASKRVFYVGGESSVLRTLILEQHGYQVTMANSAARALHLFTVGHFDIVINEVAGDAAAAMVAAIRQRDSRIPVIALSDEPPSRGSPQSGDAWVRKVDGPYALLAKVEALLRRDDPSRSASTDELENRFPGASELLRPFVATMMGVPDPRALRASQQSAEEAEAEIREFKSEITESGNQSRSAVLSRVAERIRLALCADGAAIAFVDSHGLICEASTGDAPAAGARLHADSRLTRGCFDYGQIELCEDAWRDSRITPWLAESLNFRSAIVVPIQGRCSVLGLVEVFSSRVCAFDSTHVVRLARIARLLVRFAREFEQPRQRPALALVKPRDDSRQLTRERIRQMLVGAAVGAALTGVALIFVSLGANNDAHNDAHKDAHKDARNGAHDREPGFTTPTPTKPGVSMAAPVTPESAEEQAQPGPAPQGISRQSSSGREFSPRRPRYDRSPETLSEKATSPVDGRAVAAPITSNQTVPAPPPSANDVFLGTGPSVGGESAHSRSDLGTDSGTTENDEIAAAIRPVPPPVEVSVPDFVLDHTLKGHSGWVTGLAFSRDGHRLASGSWDRSVKFWDVLTGRELGAVSGDVERIQTLAFSGDGLLLAAENSDNTVTLWNAATGQELRTLPGNDPPAPFASNWVYSIAFSPNGRLLAYAVDNKTVRLWDVTTSRSVRELSGARRSVIYIAFSPDGRLLATGKDDKTINVWDVESARVVHTFGDHKRNIYAVAFSPDGRQLASAGGDKSVKLWDLATGTEIHDLKGHRNRVTTLAFSPDGRWLASGSWDKTVKIWDTASGRELETLSGHAHDVYTIAFDSDGRWLASGSEDGTVKLWRLKTGVSAGPAFSKEGGGRGARQ